MVSLWFFLILSPGLGDKQQRRRPTDQAYGAGREPAWSQDRLMEARLERPANVYQCSPHSHLPPALRPGQNTQGPSCSLLCFPGSA